MKKIEEKHYKTKLKKMLDQCEFFTGKDSTAMTPRSYFEENYKLLCTTPIVYFKRICDEVDCESADTELYKFIKDGGEEKAACLLVESEINTLDGVTLTLNDIERRPSPKAVNNIIARPKQLHHYKVAGHHGQDNKITDEVDTLLGIEKGLLEQLEGVQELLSAPYSADSNKTAREVFES